MDGHIRSKTISMSLRQRALFKDILNIWSLKLYYMEYYSLINES